MDSERSAMFVKYANRLKNSSLTYETRAKYLESALGFLEDSESVSKKGYKSYFRQNASLLVTCPFAKDGVVHFLSFVGIGFKPFKESPSKRTAQNLQKRDVRCYQALNNFITWLDGEKDLSPNTLTIYYYRLKDYFSYFDDFNQDNCRKYVSWLEENGTALRTINLSVTALEHFACFSKKTIKLKRPKIQRTLNVENVPTEAEYNHLCEYLSSAKKDNLLFLIQLMATTGCRVSELKQFTYEMVSKGHCILKGKGAKYRQFFFVKSLQEKAKGQSGLIMKITDRGLSERLKYCGDKCGIAREKMHAHAFRHFFAKMYLKKTKDVVQLADILGHSSVDTTRIYLKKSNYEQQREINRNVTW